jgi:hypothetical protein
MVVGSSPTSAARKAQNVLCLSRKARFLLFARLEEYGDLTRGRGEDSLQLRKAPSGVRGQTPTERAGITVMSENKWLSLLKASLATMNGAAN